MIVNKFLNVLGLISLLCLIGCSSHQGFRQEEGMAWNTVYHITYDSDKDLSDSILLVFDEIDRSLSPFNRESVVSKINDNRSSKVDAHLSRVHAESVRINAESEGAFDPTLAPLIRAWGFGQGHEVSADTLKLDSLLSLVGISKTRISDGILIKENPDIEFNFSALAKGYGVDCIADMLERNGVKNYLVEVGGEIRSAGHNPRGEKWSVGIDRPVEGASVGDMVMTVCVGNSAIATSGNYRNYQDAGNKRFGHTISPVTGRPVESDVISATIVCNTCMEADALATSCMVLGSEKALDLCNRLKAGVMLVRKDMSVITNPLFDSFITSSDSASESGSLKK